MFLCPNCLHKKNQIMDTRLIEDGSCARRRRKCWGCFHRWTTYEDYKPSAKELLQRTLIEKGKLTSRSRAKVVKTPRITIIPPDPKYFPRPNGTKEANAVLKSQLAGVRPPPAGPPIPVPKTQSELDELIARLTSYEG